MVDGELKDSLTQLNEFYQVLINQPEPEQEEEAQKEMVPLLEKIQGNLGDRTDLTDQISALHEQVKNWKTLDNWFYEVKGLAEKMKSLLIEGGILTKESVAPVEAAPSKPEPKQEPKPEPKDTSSEKVDEYEARMKAMEERMKSLEEREKKLEAKENELKKKEKQQKAQSAPKTPLKSKLSVPKLSVPKVAQPKKKIAPSTVPKTSEVKFQAASPVKPVIKMNSQKIKINISGGATPIKINPTPLKINPVGATSAPQIKPVGGGQPSIRPVGGQPQMRPVGGQPSIRPVGGQPQIRPVGGQPQMKPVGGVSRPQFKAVGNISRPKIQPGMKMPAPNDSVSRPGNVKPGGAAFQKPSGPVNLFDQQVGKKPVNLFDQPQGKKSAGGQVTQGAQGGVQQVGGPAKKVTGLGKMDFSAQKAQTLSDDNKYLLSLPPSELYYQLIKFESQQFFYDKQLKEAEQSHSKGRIAEAEFRGARERFNFEIDSLGSKIKDIRALILN